MSAHIGMHKFGELGFVYCRLSRNRYSKTFSGPTIGALKMTCALDVIKPSCYSCSTFHVQQMGLCVLSVDARVPFSL